MLQTDKKPTMIYIMSPSYSGSTLLTFLMANHSEISTIGELKATSLGNISKYNCSCGSPFLECDFWINLQKGLQADGVQFQADNFGTNFSSEHGFSNKLLSSRVRGQLFESIRMALLKFGPSSAEYKKILERNKLIADKVCELQGGHVFMDGSKNCNRLVYFANAGLWNLKVVNLVRDERGQLCSLMRREKSSMAEAIERLIQVRKEQKTTLSIIGKENYISINYSELCKNTLSSLNQIYRFVGISAVADANLSKNKHHILGNSMRLSNVDEIRIDERWKQDLSETDLQVYGPYAGKINSILGSDVAAFED